jgi:hypothetical protein
MAKLGDRVTFFAPMLNRVQTVKDGTAVNGSTYAFDQVEFAAIVGKLYSAPKDEDDHTKAVQLADLFLLVPGKLGQWVFGIPEGKEAGQFKVVV